MKTHGKLCLHSFRHMVGRVAFSGATCGRRGGPSTALGLCIANSYCSCLDSMPLQGFSTAAQELPWEKAPTDSEDEKEEKEDEDMKEEDVKEAPEIVGLASSGASCAVLS